MKRHPVPGATMRALRLAATASRRGGTQERVARLLGSSPRSVWEWERHGTSVTHAYAYVGLAWRLGGDARARAAWLILAQLEGLDVEGLRVAPSNGDGG